MSDEIIRWVFANTGEGCYLVGGRLRDAFAGIRSADLDFALKEAPEPIAELAASTHHGTVVPLNPPDCYRVVLKSGVILDFSRYRGGIVDDIMRRDFTVNSLAWSPSEGLIADPRSLADIKNKVIRTRDVKIIEDDPLRILRAYRLSAELSFAIDERTRRLISDRAALLPSSSSERITEELFRIMNTEYPDMSIYYAIKDNVFHYILGIDPGKYDSVMESYHRCEKLLKTLYKYPCYKEIYDFLDATAGQNITFRGLLRLVSITEGYESLRLLTISNRLKKLFRIQYDVLARDSRRTTRRDIYEILHMSHPDHYLSLISLALSLKKKSIDVRWINYADLYSELREDELMSGFEILEIIGKEKEREIGRIKEELLWKRFSGEIRDSEDARDWILSNFT